MQAFPRNVPAIGGKFESGGCCEWNIYGEISVQNSSFSVQFGHRLNDLKAWDSKVQGPGWLRALGIGEGVMGSQGLGA